MNLFNTDNKPIKKVVINANKNEWIEFCFTLS